MDRVTLERVPPEVVLPLRQRVLRPHQPMTEVRFPGDDDVRTGTYAALAPHGEVIGVVTVHPEPCPWRPAEDGAWRLRGMATADHARGLGIGSALLRAALDHVVAAGGGLVWCNARTPARGFYARAGFSAYGEPWDLGDRGPHVRMWRQVSSGSGTP
jgi:GNAT superfamily N-acetyltransferase